jgi:hypothetical protein
MAFAKQSRSNATRPYEVPEQSAVLTTATINDESIVFPVNAKYMDNRIQLRNRVFFHNTCGVKLRVLGTPLKTQIKHESEIDPANYDIFFDEQVDHDQFFSWNVHNVVYVSWSVTEPQNEFPKGDPCFIVNCPNGQIVEFYWRNGEVFYEISDDSNESPNCLRFVSTIKNTTIHVDVFTTDPRTVPSNRILSPVWSADITSRRHQEYQHIIDWTVWIVECLDIKPRLAQSARPVAQNTLARQSGTGRFEVGSIKWWDVVQNVNPGDYISAIVNTNETGPQFLMDVRYTKGLKLIKDSQYFLSK